MKKGFCLLIALYFLAAPFSSAQDLRLPRDPEKLIDRVQKFWAAMASGQRLRALEFVLPERKDLFASGSAMPILKARVLGVDLTDNPSTASVRIALDVLAPEAGAGRVSWTITDPWVWRTGNWFLDLESPPAIFPKTTAEAPDVKRVQSQIESNFEILRNPVDLGTLTAGQTLQVEVPIKYTGDALISVEQALPNPVVDLAASAPITAKSKNLILLVGTEHWEGPFNLPLLLKLRSEGATVERTIMVKGEVFVPVTFRQSPANGPIEVDREFSVFIRNNTDQQADIQLISTDAKLDVVKKPPTLLPNAEVELVLKLRKGESPDRLYLQLSSPIRGRDTYAYQFRNVR